MHPETLEQVRNDARYSDVNRRIALEELKDVRAKVAAKIQEIKELMEANHVEGRIAECASDHLDTALQDAFDFEISQLKEDQ